MRRDLLASIIECLIRAGVQDRNVRQQLFFNDELRKLLDGCDIDKILEILSDYSDMNGVKSYIDRGGQAMGVLAEMFSGCQRSVYWCFFRTWILFNERIYTKQRWKSTVHRI